MATRADTEAVLVRAARRHGWTAEHGRMDYYGLRFTRPEPGDRCAQLLIRVAGPDRLGEVQVEMGGLRQQLTGPSVRCVTDLLAAR